MSEQLLNGNIKEKIELRFKITMLKAKRLYIIGVEKLDLFE